MSAKRMTTTAGIGAWLAGAAGCLACAGVLAAWPWSAVAAAGQVRQGPAPLLPPPTGTASVTVQVVAADSGTPVRGARVTLFGTVLQAPARRAQGGASSSAVPVTVEGAPVRDIGLAPQRVQKEGRTDQAGTYTFTDLPAGTYTVNAMPPAAYVRGSSVPPPVQIADGGRASAVIQLDRGGVVTGRVFDEYGEPVTGATMTAWKQSTAASARMSSMGSGLPTNDLGQFRIWGLPDGEYVVGAMFHGYPTLAADSSPREGNLPTFYPGVAAFDSAKPVTVKAGQETGGLDFQLVQGRLGSVSGRATDSAGNPLVSPGMGGSVTLSARSTNPGFSGSGTSIRPDGSFVISNIPPGDYYLSAVRMGGPQPGGAREGAYVPISMNGDDITVNIQTNLGATISGRVVFEGTPPPTQSGVPGAGPRASQTRIGLQSGNPGSFGIAFATSRPAVVRPDGTFELSGVRGWVQLTAQASRAALKSVRRGASDISGQPLELLGTERVDDVVVVMTYETGAIDGTVKDAGGDPAAGAVVLVFADDDGKWSEGSPFVWQSRASAGAARGAAASAPAPAASAAANAARPPLEPGAFSVAQLPAGRYAVIALPPGTPPLTPDHEALARWRDSATIVTVVAGQTVAVQLNPVK